MNSPESNFSRISVVIPCYNASKTLISCLKGIKNQTLKPYETIVVDDGSSDDSAAIAGREGARVIRMTQNSGAAAARNEGAAQAEGDIVFFTDSDVVLHDDAIEKLLARFRMSDSPDAIIGIYSPVHSGLSFTPKLHNIFTYYNHSREEGKIEWFWGAIGAVKKEIFEKLGGFDESYSGANAEDIELGWRMARAGFNCVIEKQIQGDHLADLRLANAIKNDFRKGTYCIHLYTKHNRQFKMSYGFTSISNLLSLVAAGLSVAGVALLPFMGSLSAAVIIASLAIFAAANMKFFLFIGKRFGAGFALPGALVFFTFFVAIGFGLVWGAVELIRGKS